MNEPQQFLHDAAQKHLLRRQQGKRPVCEREAHLCSKYAARARVCAVNAQGSVVQDVANEIQVLQFFMLLRMTRPLHNHVSVGTIGREKGLEAARILRKTVYHVLLHQVLSLLLHTHIP